MLSHMATRETRLQRGRRRGRNLAGQLIGQLRERRVTVGVSQRALSRELGSSQSDQSRWENLRNVDAVSLVRIAEVASILGLELHVGLHPMGDPIRDKGHHALIRRFRVELAPAWRVTAEALLPLPGDARSWDLLLRLGQQLVGVEAETRIRDIQALVRRIRQRERDGGVDEIVLVLSDSRANRELVEELRIALGERFATTPRTLLSALRAGRPLPGSGLILV
jgi:transcriptional regulator with XRE-family HTH domain